MVAFFLIKRYNSLFHQYLDLFPVSADVAMSLNTAMFEQNARSGYVLKPSVMWDKTHVMFNRFNPWDKEFDGLHTTILTLQVCYSVQCTDLLSSSLVWFDLVYFTSA